MAVKVCFLSGARYSQPLDLTNEKKFRALKSLGDLYVIGFSRDLSPRHFTQHALFYLLPALPIAPLRYIEMLVLGPFIASWLIFRHRVQILIAQSPYEGFAAALAKKIACWLGYKTVLVVESHGDFEESVFLQRRILFSKVYRFVMRHAASFTVKHADSLRAVSNSTRKQLERWSPGKPVFQFPTWTDIESFLHCGVNQTEEYTQNVLYAGVLIPRKGTHHLINSFAYLARDFPQSRLVIVGDETNKIYSAGLKEQVKAIGLIGRVQFVGEVQQAELAAWMGRASVFVLPTYSEGLPRVVFEAMAAGLPVVASNVSGIPDILEDGVTGFTVSPGDELALTERIRWVLENPNDGHEIGLRARNFAERFFSTEAYVRGYRQLFEAAQALISEGSEPAPSPV